MSTKYRSGAYKQPLSILEKDGRLFIQVANPHFQKARRIETWNESVWGQIDLTL